LLCKQLGGGERPGGRTLTPWTSSAFPPFPAVPSPGPLSVAFGRDSSAMTRIRDAWLLALRLASGGWAAIMIRMNSLTSIGLRDESGEKGESQLYVCVRFRSGKGKGQVKGAHHQAVRSPTEAKMMVTMKCRLN
jgi:hypothetical protein